MIIIKIGGGKSINIEAIARDVAKIQDNVIIVHGANFYRDQLLKKLAIEKEILTSVKGFSSVNSTKEVLDSMMMTYAGLRNKRIVEVFQQNGINAIGLSGMDGGLVKGKRNKGIRVIENGKKKLRRDLSGKASEINFHLLNLLMNEGYTPIITMPILDENNIAINSENDDVVALLSKELKPTKIYILIEEKAFLDKDTGYMISHVNLENLKFLIDNSQGRIHRKLHAIQRMMLEGRSEIIMTDGRVENPILNSSNGTLFSIN